MDDLDALRARQLDARLRCLAFTEALDGKDLPGLDVLVDDLDGDPGAVRDALVGFGWLLLDAVEEAGLDLPEWLAEMRRAALEEQASG